MTEPTADERIDWPATPIDAVGVAQIAMMNAVDYLGYRYELDDVLVARLLVICGLPGLPEPAAPRVMAELLRKIGSDRATPAVLAQQLKIERVFMANDSEFEQVEELVVKIFADTLTAIDAFDRSIEAIWEESRRNSAVPRPVPIDETTMELVDGPLATWRGRG